MRSQIPGDSSANFKISAYKDSYMDGMGTVSGGSCNLPRQVTLYLMYYPLTDDEDKRYGISKARYFVDTENTSFTSGQTVSFELRVKFVNLVEPSITDKLQYNQLNLLRGFGAIFAPLFQD